MTLNRKLSIGEIIVIILLACIPLFFNFPYRLNIFLAWEGAYRLYLGQLPYRDFGMPTGYMFWVIPAIFFKIFGPQMITLVKAQVFINIVGGLAFRSILKSLKVNPVIRFASVILFCISYSFFNYWPWYNHTVIIYELVALSFLMKYFFLKSNWFLLVLSGIFICFSFFTKQDGGALGFLLCAALLLYDGFFQKKWRPFLIFVSSCIVTGFVLILPFAKYQTGYWFNYGQKPHSSRISGSNIISEFFNDSQWLKFYLFVFVLLILAKVWKNSRAFITDRQQVIFSLLTLGILIEAAIFQVTSYIPADNNIFFHSFAFAFILTSLSGYLLLPLHSGKMAILFGAFILIWWSQVYWKFIEKYFIKQHQYTTTEYAGYRYATEVNRNTYMIATDTTDIPLSQWRVPNLRSFRNVLLPGPTVDGIERLMNNKLVKEHRDLKVLNMSELTPLAAEIPYKLETGPDYPLWFHKGVSMFDKETDTFCNRIKNNYYDLVLFEYIPFLNNFYPFRVRDCLENNYKKIDSFPAPRKPTTNTRIEVYVRK